MLTFFCLNLFVIFSDAWFQIDKMCVWSLTVFFLFIIVFSWHPFLAMVEEEVMSWEEIWFHQPWDFCMGCSIAWTESAREMWFLVLCDLKICLECFDLQRLWLWILCVSFSCYNWQKRLSHFALENLGSERGTEYKSVARELKAFWKVF